MHNIRVEAYKLDRDIQAANKETFLITPFLERLLDRKSARAIEALKHTTLDEAYHLAKKELRCTKGLSPDAGMNAQLRAL